MRNHSRNMFIWIAAAKGRTYADIGREYGLSRERIRQIVVEFDIYMDKKPNGSSPTNKR